MPVKIVLWVIITSDEKSSGEILLLQDIWRKENKKILFYRPLRGWVRKNERVIQGVIRVLREHIFTLSTSKIKIKFLGKILKEIKGIGKVNECHYLIEIDYPFNIIAHSEIRFVGSLDLLRVQKVKWNNLPNRILLFEEDYQMLTKLLTSSFYFSKSQFLFEHLIFLFTFTKRESHFGHFSPVGSSQRAKSHFGHLLQA